MKQDEIECMLSSKQYAKDTKYTIIDLISEINKNEKLQKENEKLIEAYKHIYSDGYKQGRAYSETIIDELKRENEKLTKEIRDKNPEETWQERLEKEKNELLNKIDKLGKYLNTISINPRNHLLFDQLYCMQKYLSILSLRNDREIVECFVIDGDSTPEGVAKAFGGKVCGVGHVGEKKWVEIPTKNGVLKASYGDLIVKSINGSLSIVKGVAI